MLFLPVTDKCNSQEASKGDVRLCTFVFHVVLVSLRKILNDCAVNVCGCLISLLSFCAAIVQLSLVNHTQIQWLCFKVVSQGLQTENIMLRFLLFSTNLLTFTRSKQSVNFS